MNAPMFDIENRELQYAYELIANTNSCFFLTGRAGTGKTTFLQSVKKCVGKQFVTLAPTGIAAILAGGDTIHSFFGLEPKACGPDTVGEMGKSKKIALNYADTIIIDEVSMLRCDIVDAIDRTMRKVLRSSQPFGGKQVVFVGDMFQLPPVVSSDAEKDFLNDMYDNDGLFFFYKANVFKNTRLVSIELKKNYRQEDLEFINILENVRFNKVTTQDLERLNERVCEPSEKDLTITLTSTNKTADAINESKLNEIDSELFSYEGRIEGKFECNRLPVDKTLKLKVGAQVLFTRNDQFKRWANGTLGKVAKLSNEEVYVTTEDGITHQVPICTWDSAVEEYNKEERKFKKEIVGSFSQYPLKLAWAITIHKSQGMTFDKMSLNLTSRMFADGQLYVALSRVRSIDGLFLSNPIGGNSVRTNSEIMRYASGFNNEQNINNEIECGKTIYELLKKHQYDEASRELIILAGKRAEEGDVNEAYLQVKRFLNTVICDDIVFGCINDVPVGLSERWESEPQFVYAVLCLYANRYEEALGAIDKVLKQEQSTNALFVKSRCLEKLHRYFEADETNSIICEEFDMSYPDLKILYNVAMLNELYINDPGIEYMRMITELRPKYNKGIVTMRFLMKRNNMSLPVGEGNDCELITIFNSDISKETFEEELMKYRNSNTAAVEKLLKQIKMQTT